VKIREVVIDPPGAPLPRSIIAPVLHLNGSGYGNLSGDYEKAMQALSDAEEALRLMSPHSRDYYVYEDPNAFNRAFSEHVARRKKLEDLKDEIEALWADVLAQENEIKERRKSRC